MRKIHKIINIGVIFIIGISIASSQLTYASEKLCLRVPIAGDADREKEILLKIQGKEIKERLNELEVIKNKEPTQLQSHDKEIINSVLAHFNFSVFQSEESEWIQKCKIGAVCILSKAELVSLDYPDEISSYALTVMKGIGGVSFSHGFLPVIQDYNVIIESLKNIGNKTKEGGLKRRIDKFINIFDDMVDNIYSWNYILQNIKYSNIDSPKFMLVLVDFIIDYTDNLSKRKKEIIKLVKRNADKIDEESFREFLATTKKAQDVCILKMNELKELREHILHGEAKSLININDSIKNVLKSAKKDVKIELEFGTNLGYVYVNSLKIFHIWQNLYLNSIDAINEAIEKRTIREGIITVKTHIIKKDGEEYVEVIFSDNGIGIPDRVLGNRRLFMQDVTSKEGGTGLGLYIIDQVVKEYGGFIDARNKPEGGAEFTITLPIASNQAIQLVRQEAEAFMEKMSPIMDNVRKMIQSLEPEKELSEDTKAALLALGEEVRRAEILIKELEKPLDTRSKIYNIYMLFHHYVGNVFVGYISAIAKKAVDCGRLTEKDKENMEKGLLTMETVIAGFLLLPDDKMTEVLQSYGKGKYKLDMFSSEDEILDLQKVLNSLFHLPLSEKLKLIVPSKDL